MALSARALSDLLGCLYDVALEGESWEPFLEAVSSRFDAPIAVIRARSSYAGIERETVGVPLHATVRYTARYARSNPVLKLMRQTPPLTPVVLSQIEANRAIADSDYYTDYLRPIGCAHLVIVWSSHEGENFAGLALMRSSRQRAFSRGEATAVALLARHLDRANRARVRMREMQAEVDAGREDPTALYGFTSRETDVARLVAQGVSIDVIASNLGMGRETVKSHLRSLYQKTDTHNQAQLMYLLLRPGAPAHLAFRSRTVLLQQ